MATAIKKRLLHEPEAEPQLQHVQAEPFRFFVTVAGAALIIFLCWRILKPFLPALSWAFALALIAYPVYSWLLQRMKRPNLAAVLALTMVCAVIILPGIFLARTLVREAADVLSRFAADGAVRNLRPALEHNSAFESLFRWLDSRVDLAGQATQLARSLAGWMSSGLSSFLTGSMWVLTQVTVTMFVLFYFFRDGKLILEKMRSVLPLPPSQVDLAFARISQTIRVSLGGKLVVASIQGILGGLMFFWLGLPAPVFWGFVMAVLSVFPVIGAFLIWTPVAAAFAIQGDWKHALLLAGWGVLIIHPVDNLLGPVLVGTTLRLHTLLMFFSIVGGLAAFGAAGIVLGPVTIAIAISIMEREPIPPTSAMASQKARG